MKKSLVIIASALLLAVGAAGTQRLRYDATIFANADQTSQAVGRRAAQVEYPPCVRGVREDRCIQLYERGVRRSYARWLASQGVRQAAAEPATGARRYRPCRSRTDDNCEQVARVRTVRAARRAAPVRAVAARSSTRARPTATRAATARSTARARAAANRTRWTRAAAHSRTRARQQRQAVAAPRTGQAAPRTVPPVTRPAPTSQRPAQRTPPTSGNTPGI